MCGERDRLTDRQGEYTGTRTGTGANRHTYEHERKRLNFNPTNQPTD